MPDIEMHGKLAHAVAAESTARYCKLDHHATTVRHAGVDAAGVAVTTPIIIVMGYPRPTVGRARRPLLPFEPGTLFASIPAAFKGPGVVVQPNVFRLTADMSIDLPAMEGVQTFGGFLFYRELDPGLAPILELLRGDDPY